MFTIKSANTEKSSANIYGQGFNWNQLLLGIVVLLVGSLVYIIDRAPQHTYLIYQSSINLSLYGSVSELFGPLGNNLPSLAHTFAFILITAGLVPTRKYSYVFICLLWFAIDSLFELGQGLIDSATSIPAWFSHVIYLENTENYFINGTFDWNDVAATAIGSIVAYLVLRTTTNTGRSTS